MNRYPPRSSPFPYTTLFRSARRVAAVRHDHADRPVVLAHVDPLDVDLFERRLARPRVGPRLAHHREREGRGQYTDRKSTRLNSSHVKISYAVFCLKKKKKKD